MKLIFATFLIVSLALIEASSFLQTTTAQAAPDAAPSPAPGYPCDSKCTDRCVAAGRQRECLKDCLICCKICSCVPSGTSGNKAECPCYANMLNSKKEGKCP